MNDLTVAWIALPFFAGFVSSLLPQLDRYLALGITLVSSSYALWAFQLPEQLTLQLLDNFGVTLMVDSLSGLFILTNALVTAAVILYCWQSRKSAFFYAQTVILHGSINAVFICADFISLYVALEVTGIAAFLLIAYPRTAHSIWVGLRYLFVSNTAMLFYLIGAVLVYKANHSFAFIGLQGAPPEALALICLGLLTKGGVFLSGLWLPMTYSESHTPMSALLAGVVSKTGVFPLARCALMVEEIEPVIQIFSVGAALLGVIYASFENDTKRMLAWSSISQLGFVLAAPPVAGFYALTHGLAKAALFLGTGNLPSRDFQILRQTPIRRSLWIVLAIASLSISGFPLLAGYEAKIMTLQSLVPWHSIALNIAAVGTSIVYAHFIFLPFTQKPVAEAIQPSFWWATLLLLGGLVATNSLFREMYTVINLIKALGTIVAGWLIYGLIVQKVNFKLPQIWEQLEHLIGTMSLVLILLFWMVLS